MATWVEAFVRMANARSMISPTGRWTGRLARSWSPGGRTGRLRLHLRLFRPGQSEHSIRGGLQTLDSLSAQLLRPRRRYGGRLGGRRPRRDHSPARSGAADRCQRERRLIAFAQPEEKSPPGSGSTRLAEHPNAAPFNNYPRSSLATESGTVPALASRESERLPEPGFVPAGSPDPSRRVKDGPVESVASIAMSSTVRRAGRSEQELWLRGRAVGR